MRRVCVIVSVLTITVLLQGAALGQKRDVAQYETKTINEKERTYLTFDVSKVKKPASVESFKPVFHLPPISQGSTGTCWCFAATSLLESELKRLGKGEIKLSEMYTVYHEYIEKVRRWVREKGNSAFAQGSELNAVTERMKQYGAVPASADTGLLGDAEKHDHGKMYREMCTYLEYVKENELWDESRALPNIKMNLNKYLGEPPRIVEAYGREMTPQEYLRDVLQLPLDDYVSLMSTKSVPFYTKGEYKVPDNWWHSEEYYNVPLDDFYAAIKDAIGKGYSAALAGDTSEPGKIGEEDIALVPTFDVEQDNINQDSREFRFYNRTSTDDHAIHVIGHQRLSDHDWYLIKDSGSSARRGQFEGYYFFRDDYVKLKMLAFMVHKDAVKDLLTKFKQMEVEGTQ